MMKKRLCFSILSALVISACGGGGGGGGAALPPAPPPPPPPPASVLVGQFKDGNVQGLTFSTATQNGMTDAMGTFRYQSGENVEFSIGGVVIGSAQGQPILTPIDLVAGGTSSSTEVLNIVRFLLVLDQNEDATDGISISQSVRDVAANWTQVEFTASDFGNELVTILSDIASVDARAANLADAQAAQSHLERTMYCVMSGIFRGTRTTSGADAGPIILIVDAASGIVRATYNGNPEDFASSAPVSVDQQRVFLTERSDGDFVEGRYDSFDELSGIWAISGNSGEFTAARFAGDSGAALRFTGQWALGTNPPTRLDGLMAFNVDTAGNLAGEHFRLTSNFESTHSGALSEQNITFTTAGNATYTGSMDSTFTVADGSFTTNNGGPGVWRAQGCRLN